MKEKSINEICNLYCGNNMQKLKTIVNSKIKLFGGITEADYDDFLSKANEIVYQAAKIYTSEMNVTFESFLSSCILKKFKTMVRDRNRLKRNMINVDEDGNKTFVKPVYLDSFIPESGETVGSTISDGKEITESIDIFQADDTVEMFLSKLSSKERKIITLLMQEYKPNEIKAKLNLSEVAYNKCINSVRQNKHLALFSKTNYNNNYKDNSKEELKMETTKNKPMAIDTTDSYRTDRLELSTLLRNKAQRTINCEYISQRAPMQWTSMQVSKYYTRILNNQPIPEIIICESNKGEMKVKYLIDGLQRLTYAEMFRNNRIKIKEKGSEFTKIKYRKYEYDENGDKVLDADGNAKYTIDVCDVVGKTYKDLPEFLQARFDEFNINVTTFFNCTDEMINYHIRSYNNHCAMNKSQYAITNADVTVSKQIKGISEDNDFFVNVYGNTKNNKGALDEVVTRSLFALNFMDDWKKDILDATLFLNENVEDKHFDNLHNLFIRLYNAGVEDMEKPEKIFTPSNAHIWISAFNYFVKNCDDDSKFISFVELFNKEIKEYSESNEVVDLDIFNAFNLGAKSSKDRKTVVNKIEALKSAIDKFFDIKVEGNDCEDIVKDNEPVNNEDINEEETYGNIFDMETEEIENETENNILSNEDEEILEDILCCDNGLSEEDIYVDDELNNESENLLAKDVLEDILGKEVSEYDFELYQDMLNDLTVNVDNNTKLLDEQNKPSLLGIINYSFENDIDLDDWIVDYFSKHTTYFKNQKTNFKLMVNDLKKFENL